MTCYTACTYFVNLIILLLHKSHFPLDIMHTATKSWVMDFRNRVLAYAYLLSIQVLGIEDHQLESSFLVNIWKILWADTVPYKKPQKTK
jgi:hypothetical protein